MPKITRASGNVRAFASEALGTERTVFGEVTQANDLTSQFTTDFFRGWGIVGPSDQPSLQDFNGAMYTHGQLLAYIHQMGIPEYDAAQEYQIGSHAQTGGVLYVSLVANNVGNAPATSLAQWKAYLIPVQATESIVGILAIASTAEANAGTNDTKAMTALKVRQAISTFAGNALNSARVDVPSSANVNLGAGAPNTNSIRITGTTNVSGFTVPVGNIYIVSFAATLTLVNGAGLVTNSGADIITAAGDSCLIRATAANTVEILCYTPGIPQSVGYRQTWQDVKAARLLNTSYPNATGRTISVSVAIAARAGNEDFSILVGGVVVAKIINLGTAGEYNWLKAEVPAGLSYTVAAYAGAVVDIWAELRT